MSTAESAYGRTGTGRCPRCLATLHARNDYVGIGRRNACCGRGLLGHMVATCTSSQKDRNKFQGKLKAETIGNEHNKPDQRQSGDGYTMLKMIKVLQKLM